MKKGKYEVNGWSKFAEIDDYQEGCLPETGVHYGGNERFCADTAKELIEKLQSFCGSDSKEDYLLNSCDELGRIDIQLTENEEGITASKNEIEQWKKGEIKLWLATYTFRIEEVTRKEVDLEKVA